MLGLPDGVRARSFDVVHLRERAVPGQFGFVIDVDRAGRADVLHADCVDVVVGDLAGLLDGS